MKVKTAILVFLFQISIFSAQIKPKQFNIPQKKYFPTDTIIEFNEREVANEAIQNGFLQREVPFYVAQKKQEFLNKKYNLNENKSEWPKYSFNPIGNGGKPQLITAACSNEDFELGNISGWTNSKGLNTNSQTMAGCCPTPNANYLMCPSSSIDPATNLSLTSPFGGNWVVRLGNICEPNVVNRLSKTFSVTSSNSLFQIAYFAVFENASGHPCDATPYANISVLNCSNVMLACSSVSLYAPNSSCSLSSNSFSTGAYPSGGVPQMIPTYSAITTVTIPGSGYTSYYGYYYYNPPYTYTLGVGTPTYVVSTYTTSTLTYSVINTVTVSGSTSYYGYYTAPYTYTLGVGTPTSAVTTNTAYCQSTGSWSGWKVASLDLTPYIGTCVTIQLTASGCAYGGHCGYAYFDATCNPLNINLNGSAYTISALQNTVTIPCGINTNTIIAPVGFDTYNWEGPTSSGITSYTNPSFTTSVTGNYTLTLNSLSLCSPITKTITLLSALNPSITINSSQTLICVGQSASLTASGANTYSWNTGATNSIIAINPTITTTYTVNGTSGGCSNISSITQSVSNCTNFQDINLSKQYIKIYPNPVYDNIIIEFEKLIGNDTYSIEIINSLGQIQYQSKITRQKSLINLCNFNSGIYFIKFFNKEILINTYKVIKQ